MVKIVDHAYEPEYVIQSNLAKIKNALAKNEKVVVYHSEGFVHGRLAGIPGVEYKMCKALRRRKEVILKKLSEHRRKPIDMAAFMEAFDDGFMSFCEKLKVKRDKKLKSKQIQVSEDASDD